LVALANNIHCPVKSRPDVLAFGAGHALGFGQIEGGKTAFMQIIVRDNNVDQALRALKKKLQREGVYREMKLRRHYEKPSEKRARERAAAIRRARKLERKRMEREGAR
jgi:small subunit ribosomal protein S21